MIAISTVVTAIASVEQLIPLGEKVVTLIGDTMQSVEKVFADQVGKGASKLNIVLAVVKAFIAEMGMHFEAIQSGVLALINGAKAAYNAMTAQPA